MSLQPPRRDDEGFLGPALAGVCIAVVLSVPAAAALASLAGDSYNARVLVYCLMLLWIVTGSIVIFRRTWRGEKRTPTLARVLLWCASIWLWPLLILFGRSRS